MSCHCQNPRIAEAVATERERCARIARDAVVAYDAGLEAITDDSWQWGLGDMRDVVHKQWNAAEKHLRDVAAKIESGA